LLVNHKEKTVGFGRSGASQPDAASHPPRGDRAYDLDAIKRSDERNESNSADSFAQADCRQIRRWFYFEQRFLHHQKGDATAEVSIRPQSRV